MRDSHPALSVSLAIASLVGILGGCRPDPEAPPLPVAVRVERFEPAVVRRPRPYSGTVRERRRVELSFKVAGTVQELHQLAGPDGAPRDVQAGDQVRPGIVLARLDDSDYRRARDMARDKLGQLRAKLQAARAVSEYAHRESLRGQEMFRRNAASQPEVDDRETRYQAALHEVQAIEREAGAAEVALKQAEDDLANCTLTVPFADATVAARMVERDERMPAGKPVFTLLDESALKVVFGVPDALVERIRPGLEVEILSDAFRGETFAGRVTKIAPAAEESTRTFPVEVTISQPRGLRPGMVVTVDLGSRAEVLSLPLTAIQRGDRPGDYVVYEIVRDGSKERSVRRRVEVDGMADDRIRIKLGERCEIRPGALIAITGADRLHDGQPVRVLPDLAAASGPIE